MRGYYNMKTKTIERIKEANKKSLKGLWEMIPILTGVLLLISMFKILVPNEAYIHLFSGNYFTDPFIGALLGSILAGNPVTSYILGKGFLDKGISLIAVTAFITAWTTVGLLIYPVESSVLGKKFAISRNVSAFFISILVAIVTVIIIRVL